jgi:type IV pilus assembly protein PilW
VYTPGTKEYNVQMPSAFLANDRVIAAPAVCAGNLTLDRVTTNIGTVIVATGAAGVTLYNLGPGPKILAYAVRRGNLTVCDYVLNDCGAASVTDTSIWVPVAANIVGLKAEYGKDDPNNGGTAIPVTDTPPAYARVGPFNSTAPTTACDWTRIPAVRLAIVSRSSQLEAAKDSSGAVIPVTAAAPSWVGGSIDVSATAVPSGFTWQNYRYKVFQTVVPIRNVAWMGIPVGC